MPAEDPAQIPQHLADEAENQRHVEGHAAPGEYQDERVGHQRRPEYAQERGIRREIDPVLVEAGHVIAQRALGILPTEDLGVFEGAAAGHVGAAFARGAREPPDVFVSKAVARIQFPWSSLENGNNTEKMLSSTECQYIDRSTTKTGHGLQRTSGENNTTPPYK